MCKTTAEKSVKEGRASLGGLEPPTFRLTAERANRLRHRDTLPQGPVIIRSWNQNVFPVASHPSRKKIQVSPILCNLTNTRNTEPGRRTRLGVDLEPEGPKGAGGSSETAEGPRPYSSAPGRLESGPSTRERTQPPISHSPSASLVVLTASPSKPGWSLRGRTPIGCVPTAPRTLSASSVPSPRSPSPGARLTPSNRPVNALPRMHTTAGSRTRILMPPLRFLVPKEPRFFRSALLPNLYSSSRFRARQKVLERPRGHPLDPLFRLSTQDGGAAASARGRRCQGEG